MAKQLLIVREMKIILIVNLNLMELIKQNKIKKIIKL
jgi:hypothetical protein